MREEHEVSSQEDDEEDLENKIVRVLSESKFDARDHHFLSHNLIEDLIKPRTISQELGFEDEDSENEGEPLSLTQSEQDLVDWIDSEAKKVFATTVQCGVGQDKLRASMEIFRDNDFNDKALPVSNHRDTPKRDLPLHFPPKIWTPKRRHSFWEHQWKCLTPVFAKKDYNYDLDAECILPFIWKDEEYKQGAFSLVYKVKIHPAHQKHEHHEVAIKEIRLNRGVDQAGTEAAWEKEAMALASINSLEDDHIIKCFAAIRRGDHRYFMFPWANGGSLRDYWEATPDQIPTPCNVRDMVHQFRGLAYALHRLHNFVQPIAPEKDPETATIAIPTIQLQDESVVFQDEGYAQSIRHGDLKPENILRFIPNGKDGECEKTLGVLKLADMGLAKRHVVATDDRGCLTSTRYGTIQYEAPETVTALQGRSRLYDVWSIGCIMLEYIIWILWGNRELKRFHEQVKGATQEMRYFVETHGDGARAAVHPVVSRWIEHILKTDPECSGTSALRDLLEVVKTKLLVVSLPPNRQSSLTGGVGRTFEMPSPGEAKRHYRATAESLVGSLDDILAKLVDDTYAATGRRREGVRPPSSQSGLLTTSSANRRQGGMSLTPSLRVDHEIMRAADVTKGAKLDYTLPPKDWQFTVDNVFADAVLTQLRQKKSILWDSECANLCSRCQSLNFWSGGFAIEEKSFELQLKATRCHFCKLLWQAYEKAHAIKNFRIRFERNESVIRLSGQQSLPVLSIFRSPDSKPPLPIQLGFPKLLEPGTDSFFQLIRLWLEDCDNKHAGCHAVAQDYLPTRLIDVGTPGHLCLKLIETRSSRPSDHRYIALSHPWGDVVKQPPFTTLRKNLHGLESDDFLRQIPAEHLPATFRDTIKTTRALGIRYVWIDSICIIQGPGGDFSEEAKRMEDVFSSAYCVLAASRATGQHDGFLKPRIPRSFVTFKRGSEMPFYVCDAIDDFDQDVLQGSLNRRGWVLQERALATRTVFFTETQTYFECGEGIRCETLTKMHNKVADFLGDPQFPNKAMSKPRGSQIRYFQDLYMQYSRLEFSRDHDRPIAIAGVESRLWKAYGTKGGYGIFDDGLGNGLFHRSLLWQRGDDQPSPGLSTIAFPPESHHAVPTWSWMAYSGGIDYLDPLFGETEWEKTDVHPPWTRKHQVSAFAETSRHDAVTELVVTVRDYDTTKALVHEMKLVYDSDEVRSDGARPQCVVIARTRPRGSIQDARHYVLIVVSANMRSSDSHKIYKRIGAGYMLGKHIQLEKDGISARVH